MTRPHAGVVRVSEQTDKSLLRADTTGGAIRDDADHLSAAPQAADYHTVNPTRRN